MADFEYTTVPGKIKRLLNIIHEAGVPPKADGQWIKTVGFPSSKDSSLIRVLKFIGFTDSSAVPTSKWKQYRGANHKQVLGEAIREGYADLFKIYPDANQRNRVHLEHVFSQHSSGDQQVIANMLNTFTSLAEQAEFSPVNEQTDQDMPPPPPPPPPDGRGTLEPALHIDIQIHISPEATVDQIDQIFASMAKHLYVSKKT